MANDRKLVDLIIKLFSIDAIKFGEFTTKSGLKTPVYFDLRVMVSYPDVMETISNLLLDMCLDGLEYDHICGVPYTALPIATLLSVQTKKSMLMRRKETKAYGTKKSIEGHYTVGQTCLIVEDVVTSGSSILETVSDLRKEGLKVKNAVIILDREQGGVQNCLNNNIQVQSLLSMSALINILVTERKITQDMGDRVRKYFSEIQSPVIEKPVDRTLLTFEQRADLAKNPIAKQLFKIMSIKKTNLCLSVDLTATTNILELIEKVGEHVCLVKTHADIIEDFTEDFTIRLKELAKKFNFMLLEDRKYADIGHTVSLQYMKGMHRIGDWADCVTAHSLAGEGLLKALTAACRGVFLLAEMSCEGNLLTPDYREATVSMANKYPDLITGFVCQNKDTFKDPGVIQLTPGVQLESSKDDLGQVYNTPEKVILENGGDIIVVGRGIVAAKSPETQAIVYKNTLWDCYIKRVSGNSD